MNQRPNQPRFEMLRTAGQVTMIPVYLAVFPVMYGLLGKWLDGYFQTNWLVYFFGCLGFVSGVRQTYFIIQRLK